MMNMENKFKDFTPEEIKGVQKITKVIMGEELFTELNSDNPDHVRFNDLSLRIAANLKMEPINYQECVTIIRGQVDHLVKNEGSPMFYETKIAVQLWKHNWFQTLTETTKKELSVAMTYCLVHNRFPITADKWFAEQKVHELEFEKHRRQIIETGKVMHYVRQQEAGVKVVPEPFLGELMLYIAGMANLKAEEVSEDGDNWFEFKNEIKLIKHPENTGEQMAFLLNFGVNCKLTKARYQGGYLNPPDPDEIECIVDITSVEYEAEPEVYVPFLQANEKEFTNKVEEYCN